MLSALGLPVEPVIPVEPIKKEKGSNFIFLLRATGQRAQLVSIECLLGMADKQIHKQHMKYT